MTSINTTIIRPIYGATDFAGAAKRLDIWHEGSIGHFEILFDNITDASEILSANLVASVLGINGTTLMSGYVDDVLPEVSDESAVFSKFVKVTGRNYGRDLANLFIIKKYAVTKFDDLIEDALSVADSEITFTSPSTAPVVDADFNKTYLQNGFVDAAKLVDYDFTVKNDKSLQLWALASAPSSGVLLKSVVGANDNNILLVSPEIRAGVDIRNNIMLTAGTLNDHFSEGNAIDWTVDNCTVADDSTVFVAGASSIKVTITGTPTSLLYLQFPKYNQQIIDCSIKDMSCEVWLTEDALLYTTLYAQDDEDNIIFYVIDMPEANKWTQIKFQIGTGAPFGATAMGNWNYYSGSTSFTWKIARLGIMITGVIDKHIWLDGLKIDGVEVIAYAVDIDSLNAYGERMLPLTRTDVKSQLQLQAIADNELVVRKDPIYKLNLTCTLQTALLYAGYTVDVLAPTANIGSGTTSVTYRILSLHSYATPGEIICKGHDCVTELELIKHDNGIGADPTRFKLASSPQAAINTRYDSRLRVLEGSLTGSGSIVGGGGGGSVNWGNVPYVQLPSIWTEYTWAQLEPYLWGFDETPAWTPDDLEMPHTASYLRFKNSTVDREDYIDVFPIYSTMDPESPILFLSQHLLVKKDVSTGGMIASNQGVLGLGSGFESEGDMPQILLMHSEAGYDSRNILEINNADSYWEAGVFHHATFAKVKCATLYVDSLLKVNGDAWTFGWNGGEVTNSITVTRDTPVLELKSTSNNSELRFSTNGTNLSKIYQCQTVLNHLRVDVPFVCEHELSCDSLICLVATGTAPIAVTSTTVCTNLNAYRLEGHPASDFLTSAWNGGTITTALTITCAAPELTLSGTGAKILFYNDVNLYRAVKETIPVLETDDPFIAPSIDVANLVVNTSFGVGFTTLISNLHADNSDHLEGHPASDFLTSVPTITYDMTNFCNQTLNQNNNAIFNSVLTTAAAGAAGFKLGSADDPSHPYFVLGFDANYDYITAYGNRSIYLATASGYGVEVQRNLKLDGTLTFGDGTGTLEVLGNMIVDGPYLNINPSADPVLNLQVSGATKGAFGFDGSNVDIMTYAGDLNLVANANIVLKSDVLMNTGKNIYPLTSVNSSFCGLSDHYWNAVYAGYLLYKTSHGTFDALDDLALVKNYKVKTVDVTTKRGEIIQREVIDDSSLEFLQDEDGFYSPSSVNGFLLGCVKALVHRVEKLEKEGAKA